MIKIDYINHASVLIAIGEVKLLIDPWFFGTCFSNGWGLRYDNDKALDIARSATHLWVSHFHSDHFHVPTLKKLLEVNPGVTAIGNESYNFQLNKALQSVGFANVIPIFERKYLAISDTVSVIRFPTTGIDNMLLIRSPYGTVLNYNDCNLPDWSQKQISKKVGAVDIFMTNFNHAGKLLVSPPLDHENIKAKLKASFTKNFRFFDVKHVFPFASYHYYKAPESFEQNNSMLHSRQLLDLDEKILDIQVGDTLEYCKDTNSLTIRKGTAVENPLMALERNAAHTYDELEHAGNGYCKSLRQNYGPFTRLLPDLFIKVTDLDIIIRLNARKGLLPVAGELPGAHIAATSSALYHWFKDNYGTDSFVVGAHFSIAGQNKIPLKWQIVFGLLIDNKLSVRAMLRMLFTPQGLRFLVNRREEIAGILMERRISADYHD